MTAHTKPALDELFERRLTYPDFDPQERLARLVGLDDQKARLTKILALLVNPAGLEAWAQKHHPAAKNLLKSILRRPPLVVLAGDVGSGKTELAETIGDAVARQEKIEITLFPLSAEAVDSHSRRHLDLRERLVALLRAASAERVGRWR